MVLRSIILVSIVITSPLMFINPLIPKLGEYASKMREEFYKMLTLPIAFSLMFFLTANIIRQAGNNVQDSSFLDSLFRIILMFVSIYLMYKVTKSFSGAFGKMMETTTGKMAGFASLGTLGAGAAALGAVGRGTAGRLGASMTNPDSRLGGWIDKRRGTVLGDTAHALGKGLDRTYDFRNIGAVQNAAQKSGVKIGDGIKTTHSQQIKERKDKLEAKMDSVQSLEGKENIARNVNKFSKYNPLANWTGENKSREKIATKKIAEEKESRRIIAKDYEKEEGEARQNMFNKQNSDIQEMLRGQDQEKAIDLHKEILNSNSEQKAEQDNKPKSDIIDLSGNISSALQNRNLARGTT